MFTYRVIAITVREPMRTLYLGTNHYRASYAFNNEFNADTVKMQRLTISGQWETISYVIL